MSHEVITLVDDINVSVKTNFLPNQSIPQDKQFVFSYTITITNNSLKATKLLTRSWLITDAENEVTTVEGEGVIGETPTIAPNQSFTYTSGCLLKTPIGTMQGHYIMQQKSNTNQKDKQIVQVNIPVFTLAIPHILN